MTAMPTNYERAFEPRPEVYAAWVQLNTAIKAGMDLRRYELATLAAARKLRSSYCSLAHGSVLAERFGEPVVQIAADRSAATATDRASFGSFLPVAPDPSSRTRAASLGGTSSTCSPAATTTCSSPPSASGSSLPCRRWGRG